jgi:DNA replication protein DnaC
MIASTKWSVIRARGGVGRPLEARHGRAIARRLKSSRLQSQATIDGFHFHHHKSRMQAKNRILRLLDLTFLQQGTNLALIGNPDPATL